MPWILKVFHADLEITKYEDMLDLVKRLLEMSPGVGDKLLIDVCRTIDKVENCKTVLGQEMVH